MDLIVGGPLILGGVFKTCHFLIVAYVVNYLKIVDILAYLARQVIGLQLKMKITWTIHPLHLDQIGPTSKNPLI